MGRSRRWTAVAVSVLAMTGLVGLPAAADHVEVTTGDGYVTLHRYAGANRHATATSFAVESTRSRVADPATAAVIARASDFPDALAGAYLAGQVGGPVLLTRTSELDPDTRDVLTRTTEDGLDVDTVYLLGGPAAISEEVEAELRDVLGLTVVRLAGDNRYATAAAIVTGAPGGRVGLVDGKRTAILAVGTSAPDALVAGAAAAGADLPMLLTTQSKLPEPTIAALDSLDIEQVVIAGGLAVVGLEVENELGELGISSIRLAGDDRNETAVEFAKFNVAQLGFTTRRIGIVRGDTFPDALAFGPYAGRERFSVLLTRAPGNPTGPTLGHLSELASCAGDVIAIAGGTNAVTTADAAQVRIAFTPTDDCTAPTDHPPRMLRMSSVGDVATITMTEDVTCTGAVPGQLAFVAANGTVVAATSLACDGSDTITATFPAGTLGTPAVGTLRHRSASAIASRIADAAGNTVPTDTELRLGTLFVVDSLGDTVDVTPGDGVCADDAGDCTLRAAVGEANASPGADTITVPAGTVRITRSGEGEDGNATGDLDVTESLTISGAGASVTVIDGDGIDRLVHVLGGDVLLTDLRLVGGLTDSGEHGGAILAAAGRLDLDGVSVIGNQSGGNGGGVAAAGAAVHAIDVEISSNAASGDGGGLWSADDVETFVSGSRLDLNTADLSGGAIAAGSGVLDVRSTTMATNTASGRRIPDDPFTDVDELVVRGGGGIAVMNGLATLMDVTVEAGVVDGFGGSGGGILGVTAVLDIVDSTIRGSDARRSGGGIESHRGQIALTRTVIDGNSASINGGGLHITDFADAMVIEGSFTDNVAGDGANLQGEGGGIWNGPGTLTVQGTTFSGNEARGQRIDDDPASAGVNETDPKGGGGLFNAGGEVSVEDATFTGDSATGDGGAGGAILNDRGTIVVHETVIDSASAVRSGGGVESEVGMVNLVDVTIRDATAMQGAGVSVTGPGQVDVNRGIFTGNVAALLGGGLLNDVGAMNIAATTISGNSASSGGGLFNVGGAVRVVSSTVSDNTATDPAGDGGGIASQRGSLVVARTTVSGNTAAGAGGGIANVDGQLNVDETTIVLNAAADGGGGVVVDAGDAQIRSTTITDNTEPDGIGSQLRARAGTVKLTHVTVHDGVNDSGAALRNDGATTVMVNGIVSSPAAGVASCAGTWSSEGGNVIFDASCGIGGTNDLESTDAELAALADNGGPTVTQLPASPGPAIDNGTSEGCLAVDQRGLTRVAETCDSGAVER